MRLAIVLSLTLLSCDQLTKPKVDMRAEEEAVRSILDAQVIAWNNGDLEAYLAAYWKSDSLQFVTPRGVSHGWNAALESYRNRFPDRVAMGTVSYDILSVSPLSPEVFVVLGKFQVTRAIGQVEGIFTLLFRKVDGRWVVVYDHTS